METKLDDKNRDDARQTETTLDKQRRSKMETKLDEKKAEATLDKQRRSKMETKLDKINKRRRSTTRDAQMETKLDEINRDDARQKTLSRVLNLTQQFHYSTKKEGIGNLYTDT